jgi:hypothetical protein
MKIIKGSLSGVSLMKTGLSRRSIAKTGALLIGLLSLFGKQCIAGDMGLRGYKRMSGSIMSEPSLKEAYNRFLHMNASDQLVTVGLMRMVVPRIMKGMKSRQYKVGCDGLIPQGAILNLNNVGKCSLYFNKCKFSIKPEGSKSKLPCSNVDNVLSQFDDKMMNAYLKLGKIGISRGGDGYILRAHVPGHGGYWLASLFQGIMSAASFVGSFFTGAAVLQATSNVAQMAERHAPLAAHAVGNMVDRGIQAMGYQLADGSAGLVNYGGALGWGYAMGAVTEPLTNLAASGGLGAAGFLHQRAPELITGAAETIATNPGLWSMFTSIGNLAVHFRF